MGYEITKLVIDIIFGACALGIGLNYLITPYEKLKENNPKLKSEKMIKACGVVLVICGVMLIVMGILGLI